MERLTHRHDVPNKLVIYARLAEYEDTGLTPEEIVELTGFLPALPKRRGRAPRPKAPAPDQIDVAEAAKLLAAMFGAKPCQLATVFPGLSRRLPLRCSFSPELCDHRTVAECWERLLGYPTMADKMKEE